MENTMTNIADNVIAIEAAIAILPQNIADAVKAAVAGIVIPAPVVDFSEVLAELGTMNSKLDTIIQVVDEELADLSPTPATPTEITTS